MNQRSLGIPLDIKSGQLGTGVQVKNDTPHTTVRRWSHHPTTDEPIEGVTIPHWQRIKELALKPHTTLPRLGITAWDIGLSANGPILIEGNTNWAFDLVQIVHDTPIEQTRLSSVPILL